MQHYFITNKVNDYVEFHKDDVHHIVNVMRFKSGDQVIAIFNAQKYLCELVINKDKTVSARVIETIEDTSKLPIKVRLIYSMPKGEKFELVLQKACELGVSEIIPVYTSKCIVSIDEKKIDNKMERWNKILKEASEQSRRADIPLLYKPIKKEEVKNYMLETNLIGDEREVGNGTLKMFDAISNAKSLTVLIGCEGGFTKEEFNYFEKIGFKGVSFGRRILRSETAAIYALSCVAFVLESRN